MAMVPDPTPRIRCALPLLDFDWKLQYAVASGSIASVNKPLLRLELYVAKSVSKAEEAGIGRISPENNQIQASVVEFTAAELDALIGAMDAIDQNPSESTRQTLMDTFKAESEADAIARLAVNNLHSVLNSFKACLHVLHTTKRRLELDPECFCVQSSSPKWEQRKRLHQATEYIQGEVGGMLNNIEARFAETAFVITNGDVLPECSGNNKSLDDFRVGGGEGDVLWCDRVCVHEKVEMDGSLWCNLPQTMMELVFARLPLHQMFQLRALSKQWRALITSGTFQSAFGSTPSRRFAFVAGTEQKRLWSFGTVERRWYTLPFNFLPVHYDVPIAGDGGLLCCRRPASFPSTSRGNQITAVQDLQLYVCNPLTQTFRKLPLPSYIQHFSLVHLVLDRQMKSYTITIVDDSLWLERRARVEVYSSTTNSWNTSTPGIFNSSKNNLIYFKDYAAGEFHGIRAYDKTTGQTNVPIPVPPYIYFCEAKGFFPLVEYQGELYVLQTEVENSGIWVLVGPSHRWEKICSVPRPEILEFYLFSLYVYGDVIIIFGDQRDFHDATFIMEDPELQVLFHPYVMWMFDRVGGTWVDMGDHELDLISFSEVLFEMRLDDVP